LPRVVGKSQSDHGTTQGESKHWVKPQKGASQKRGKQMYEKKWGVKAALVIRTR